jgi:hypothetical protein
MPERADETAVTTMSRCVVSMWFLDDKLEDCPSHSHDRSELPVIRDGIYCNPPDGTEVPVARGLFVASY